MTLSYIQAIVIGLLQGVSELFPVSSLGHSVLIPALLGWHNLVNGQSAGESFYLAFVVGLHVATAGALILYFWRDWVAIARGFIHSLKTRSIETADERIAWLLVVATVPVGLTGLLFEHTFRTLFAKPLAAAVFLRSLKATLQGCWWTNRRERSCSSSAVGGTESSPACCWGPSASTASLAPTVRSWCCATRCRGNPSRCPGCCRSCGPADYKEVRPCEEQPRSSPDVRISGNDQRLTTVFYTN